MDQTAIQRPSPALALVHSCTDDGCMASRQQWTVPNWVGLTSSGPTYPNLWTLKIRYS
jgi:hypothetical protein